MYHEFYGLKAKPFYISPDPDFFFMSPKHREALSCMEFGLVNNVGITLISGEVGIGKTTLIRQLYQMLESHIQPVCITNTNVSPEQFLILIANAFGADVPIADKAGAVKTLERQLEKVRAEGQLPLLIIDDAQNLSFDAMDEVSWLSNLQNRNSFLVQIMMLGQPELRTKIQHPSMASLAQRIGIGYHLEPFNSEETYAYINHRIAVVGGPENLFTSEALDLIYNTTGGIPRTINLLCESALVYGYADELKTIDVDSVQQAIDEIGEYGVGFTTPTAQAETAVSPDDQTPQSGQGQSHNGNSKFEKRLDRLESRLELLDRSFGVSNKNLLETIKLQIAQEKHAKNKLLIELTQLKQKYAILKKKSAASAALNSMKKN